MVLYSSDRILVSNKRSKVLINTKTWTYLLGIVLNDRSQTHTE
jgi:hypothetical protein